MRSIFDAYAEVRTEFPALADVHFSKFGGPLADAIPANTTTTATVSVPGTVSGVIDTIGDFDWYRMTLTAGVTYSFACNNAGGQNGLINPGVEVYDAAGHLLARDEDSGPGPNALIASFTAPTTGVYYLGADGLPTSTGDYSLVVSIVGGVDLISADTSTTGALSVGGGPVTGTIDSAFDHDWYRVNLVAGESYAFSLDSSGASPVSDPFLEVYDASGRLVSLDDDGGAGLNALMHFTATSSGAYYLSAEGIDTLTGEYTISADVGPPQNPLDTLDLGFTFHTSNINVYFATTGQNLGPTGAAIRSFTADEIHAVMTALGTIASVANISFTQTLSSSAADFTLTLAHLDPGVLGITYPDAAHAYIAFDPGAPGWTATGLQANGLGFSTIIHEAGHGLGLDHPHYDGGDNQVMQGVLDQFDSYGAFLMNQQVFTIMSYNDGWPVGPAGVTTSFDWGYAGTPMALDIAALQQRYGANVTTSAGNTTYLLNDSTTAGGYTAIWDTGGVDTIFYSGLHDATIDLRAASLQSEIGGGGFVSFASGAFSGYTIANGVVIENATGGFANDTVTGNDANNTLNGNSGSDVLFGGAGNDVIVGGPGSDTIDGGAGADAMNGGSSADSYVVDNAGDTIVEDVAASDLDFVNAYIDFVLPAGVENAQLYGDAHILTGNLLANVMAGNDGGDTLSGLGGDDHLSGGAGNDVLIGGAGGDILDGGAGVDVADYSGAASSISVDVAGPGAHGGDAEGDLLISIEDIIATSFDDTLGGLAVMHGGDGDDALRGYFGVNELHGDAGNDTLIGGPGADILDGGLGVDTANYSDSSDAIRIDLAAGTGLGGDAQGDTLSFIENLTGSAFADVLFGNADANILDGGAGVDYMAGDLGDDTYLVDNGGDNPIENVGEGYDVINTSVAYAMTLNVEEMHLLGAVQYGVGNFQNNLIFGNASANELQGLDGNDTLHGDAGIDLLYGQNGDDVIFGEDDNDALIGDAGNDSLDGGAAQDYMAGGVGDDTYFVDNIGDNPIENPGGGNDTIFASTSYAMTLNVETMYLTGTAPYGVGNSQDNVIYGNDSFNELQGLDGNDTLFGGGGGAFDLLYGQNGNDTLSGQDGDDALIGGEGNDSLDGGTGADYLLGGNGNDTYFVDDFRDYPIESPGEGNDTIMASVSYTITANVETMQLVGSAQNGNGNDDANTIIGNGLVNEIHGLGGDDHIIGGGNTDFLYGGAGADTFIYQAASDAAPVTLDAIMDFQVGVDHIDLSAVHTSVSDTFFFTQSGGNTFLHVDLGGNGSDDMLINIFQVTGVTNADVIWGP